MKEFTAYAKRLFTIEGLIAMVLASLGVGYFLAGFDLIPDTFPVVGYFDDVAMVVLAFGLGGLIIRSIMGRKKG